MNRPARTSWWELASAGTLTCTSLTALSFWVQGEAARALPIYNGGGAVNVEGVVPGANASIRVTAERGLVRWQDFSVQAGERFRIEGNSSQAILNVVTGPDASRIGGVVESGPRFLLANPNGIEVLGTGQIIAPSTWLTTGRVSEDDWLQRRQATPAADVSYPHIRLDRQTAINVAGTVYADDGGSGGRGGEVTLLAQDIELAGTALISANGASGGGTIHVGGQAHGLGSEPTASRVTVAAGAKLEANATKAGDGGEVVVWSEDLTRFGGQIQAQGGPEGGNGGFVEVSGRQQLDFQGLVNTMAPQGLAGTLLLDPTDLTINNVSDSNITPASGVAVPSGSPSVLTWSTIQSTLSSTSLVIQTTSSPASGVQTGTITIADASPDLNLAGRTLTFQAAGDIKINADIKSTAQSGSLVFEAGTVGSKNSISIANGKQVIANQATFTADTILLNGGTKDQVVTSGNVGQQQYSGAVVLANNTGLSGKTVAFSSAITGAKNLTLGFSGITDLSNGVTGLQSLTVKSGGTETRLSGTLSTLEAQTYSSPVILKGDTTLTSAGVGTKGNIKFDSAVDGAYRLDITTTTAPTGGSVSFLGAVGSSTALTDVKVQAQAIALSDFKTQGKQTYLVTGDINTSGQLVATTSGAGISLSGAQMTIQDATTIQTNAGQVDVNAVVNSANSINYNDLTVDVQGKADINFSSSIGATIRVGDLKLHTKANALIPGAVYANSVGVYGDSLTKGSGGTIVINGGLVDTFGDQIIRNSLTLGAATTLQGSGQGTVIRVYDVDSSKSSPNLSLTISNSQGDVEFFGSVGSTYRLGDINVDAGGTTRFGDPGGSSKQIISASSLTTDQFGDLAFDLHGGEIITSGSQTYNDAGGAVLASDIRLSTNGGTGSALFVAGPIDAAVSTSPNLTIDVTGTATFSGAIGATHPLGLISIDNSYGTTFAASLAADRLVFQPTTVIPSASGSNYLRFLGDLTLISSLEFNPTQALNYQPAYDVSLLGLKNSVGSVAGTTFFDNTGVLTIGREAATALTLFAGGVQASNTQAKISLAGVIQAGNLSNGIIDLHGSIELRHDTTAKTPDPVSLLGGVVKLAGTVNSSSGQAVSLAIDTSADGLYGHVDLEADVGLNQSLASVATLNSLGSLTINSSSIMTKGGQSYAEATTELFGHDLTATSLQAGTISFGGTLDVSKAVAAVGLNVVTDGISRFSGAIGSSHALADLSIANYTANSNLGQTELNGGSITTDGDQIFAQKIVFGADTAIVSKALGTIRFVEALDGAKALSIDSAGPIEIQSSVGATTPLTSLTTLSKTGTTTLDGGSITTTGAQSFAGPLLVGANTTLISTSSGAITFNGTVNSAPSSSYGLTINTAGLSTLAADIGTIKALSSLTTDAPGSLLITAPTIDTTGIQAFSDATITVGAKASDLVTLKSTSGNILLGASSADHVEGPGGLVITTSADVTINGVVGGTKSLDSLLISAKTIDLHDVTTTKSQTYNAVGTITTHSVYTATAAAQPITFNGSLVLADDTTVITDQGVVSFTKTVDSDSGQSLRDLTVKTSTTPSNSGGDIKFLGDVGTTESLGNVTLVGSGLNLIQGLFRALSLSADTTGITNLAGGSITTTNQQSYLSSVQLLANTTLTSTNKGSISFATAKTLTSPTTAYNLVVNTSGATIFGGLVGFDGSAAISLASIHTDAGGTVEFNGGRVQTIGDQIYGENANLGADLLLQSDQGGAITLSGAVDATSGLNSALQINTSGLTTLAGRVGSSTDPLTSITTDQPGTVLLSGGSITTVYDQTYHELAGVQLGADTVLTSLGLYGSVYHVWFDGPLDGTTAGQQSLAIYTQGLTHFGDHVGGQVALESVFTDGLPSLTNKVEILANGGTGGLVATTGSQSYGENVLIHSAAGENTRFVAGGPISFAGPVDLDSSGQPGHLTIEAQGSSVSFGQDVGLQTPFLTVTVLTDTLNLNASTINVNGWDALNPNSFNAVPTAAAIALQGTTSVNSSILGGIQGGSVLNLQNVSPNNSRWLVWSYAPWTNNQPTPTQSLPNGYGVQYQTPYNVTMQAAPYVYGNQFLYLVANVPLLTSPPQEPAFFPFDNLLNVLQPPLDLKPPDLDASIDSLGDYIQLSSSPQPVASNRLAPLNQGFDDDLAFSGPLGGKSAELLLAFAPSTVLSDTTLGFNWLAQSSGSGVRVDALTQQPAQKPDSSSGLTTGSAGAHDYTPASVEFPSFLQAPNGGSSAGSNQRWSAAAQAPVQVYRIPKNLLVGFPTSPVRLEDLQISGYQFRAHPFRALPRNRKGRYLVPLWLRHQADRRSGSEQVFAPNSGLMALEVVVERQLMESMVAAEARESPLERLTIAVQTAFGTVIQLNVPVIDLLISQ